MTSKADYTEDEWARLRRAPMIAGMAISIADPGGPIEITHETMATLKAASSPPSDEELLTALSQDIMAKIYGDTVHSAWANVSMRTPGPPGTLHA